MTYWTRGLSLVQSPRAVCYAGLRYERGPWPGQTTLINRGMLRETSS